MSIAVGNGLTTPSLSSLVSRAARSDQQGHAQGLAQASSALARIGAPIAAGSAFELMSPAAPMLAGAALLVAVCIPLALRS
jgi:MFS family permease